MFGRYEPPVLLESQDLTLSLEAKDDRHLYRRTGIAGEKEIQVISPAPALVVNPIEPLTLPQEGIAHFLEVAFPSIVLAPAGSYHTFLTMPVEIGVFIGKNSVFTLIDRLSLSPVKYSLYGDPESGVITRLHRSLLSSTIPPVDPLREGVLSLTLTNLSTDYTTLSRVVVGKNEICLWFDHIAAMTAEMNILSPGHAEVQVSDTPLLEGMEQGIERYNARKVAMIRRRICLMEHGVT